MLTAVETESQLKVKAEEDSSVNTKLCSPENELDNNKILQEVCKYNKLQCFVFTIVALRFISLCYVY